MITRPEHGETQKNLVSSNGMILFLVISTAMAAAMAYAYYILEIPAPDTNIFYISLVALMAFYAVAWEGVSNRADGDEALPGSGQGCEPKRPGLISAIEKNIALDTGMPEIVNRPQPGVIDLDKYRNYIYFWFSFITMLTMFAIAGNNFLQDRILMGYVTTGVSLIFLTNVLTMRHYGQPVYDILYSIVPVLVALPVTVSQMGVIGVFWSFTGIVLLAFILPSGRALAMNLILIAMVSPMIYFELSSTESTRAFITLGLVTMLTYVFARVIERQRMELTSLVTTDQLTGAHNRFRMEQEIENAVETKKRYQTKTSAMAIDIDHFKKVNDKLGHLAGDRVLQKMVAMFKQKLRSTDMVFRYGGEEFIILLPRTDRFVAKALAERLRLLASDTNLTSNGPVTISIGVTELYENDNRDTLLARTDGCLYKAKSRGRNMVVMT